MSERKTCDQIIDQIASEANAHYPYKDEVVSGVTIASEVDEAARKLLTWIKQDEGRRAALAQIAGGSSCQLSAAREVRHRMIELHSVKEPLHELVPAMV